MKKKCLTGIIFLFVLFAFIPKNDVKARTLYNSKAELFLRSPVMRIYQTTGWPLNSFTEYDKYLDLSTYSCYDPMLLMPGGGTYICAQTNITDIWYVSGVSVPHGWYLSSDKTSISITVPENVERGTYNLCVDCMIYEYTGEFISAARIDMDIVVGAYTTDCTIEVLDAETGEPIVGALVDGELGYLKSDYKRNTTGVDGTAEFSDLDTLYNYTREITIEAFGYETLTTTFKTGSGDENIFRSYSLTPRSRTGKLIVGVTDVFGDLKGVDVYVSNGRLVNRHYKTDKNGTAQSDAINPGTYHIVITKEGYRDLEVDVEMPESGNDVTINKQLIHDKVSTLTIHIKDVSGTSIPNGKIDINEITFDAQENGTLIVKNLPLDEYMLTIYSYGYVTKKQRIYFQKAMELDICLDSIDTLPDIEGYDIYYRTIDAGYRYSIYINDEQQVYGTGENDYGQLTGVGSVKKNKYITDQVIMTAPGCYHQLFLKQDGTVWAVGKNHYGQLGDGTTINKRSLVQVKGLSNVIQIAAGTFNSMALKADGTVWAWGYNDFGQLGIGSKENQSVPVQVTGVTDVKQIACGSMNSYFLKKDGSVYSCGSNFVKGLGTGRDPDALTPVRISKLRNIRYIASGQLHAVAIDKKGLCYMWGYNYDGQLGNNEKRMKGELVQNPYLSNIRYAAASYFSTILVDGGGNVYQCGASESVLPDADTIKAYHRPVKVEELSNISFVAAGYDHLLACENDGTIWRWGQNKDGQLGNNTTTNSADPICFETEKALANNTYPVSSYTITFDEDTETKHVSINKKGEYRYYRFIAPRTGTYTIRSISTSTDPYGYLLDNNQKQLTYNDDAPSGYKNPDNTYDFYMSRTLQAGHTYYIKTRLYSSSKVGSFKLKIICPEQVKHSVTKAKNPKLYQALKSNRNTLDSGNTGTISANELEELTGTLFLSSRGITDITGLENCVNIQQLYLDRNEITNMDELSELTNLITLDVSDNKITDLSPVAGLEHLKVLNAARNRITDIQGVAGLKHLRYLYLEDNAIGDGSDIGTNQNLRHITLQNNELDTLEGMNRCSRLNQLNISGNEDITDLKPLENLWYLQDVRLSNTGVTTLDRLPNNRYEHLYVNGCSISQEEKDRIQKEYSVGNIVY